MTTVLFDGNMAEEVLYAVIKKKNIPEHGVSHFKTVISLEMKCPQLSKPEATMARNQNSIGDRTEKKKHGRNQAQSGGQFPSGETNQ